MKSKKLTKANLYQDITQQGFILPKSSSTICNLAYLLRVRNGTEYCPLKEEVNGVFCSNPPKKLLLLVYVQEELEKNGDMRTLSFDEKHLPDVDWCLKALSSLDPLHQIFEPDYMPPFNHRGRRGIRYSPTAEDLLFIDEEKSGDTGNRNPSNQPAQDPASQYPSSHKEESKTSDFRKQFNQQAKNDKSFFNKAFKGQHESSQSQDRQSDELEDIKSKNFSKDLIENKQIGPLVQMLKTLDNKGLLEECMQHYIEIQTSYDNVIYEKQQSKTSSEIMKIQPLCKDRKKGYYFTQQKNYKRKDIQCHFKQKQNQFTQIQSPTSKLVYDDENSNLKCLSYQYKKLQQPKDFESHQTSASSDVKNQMHQMPAQIQKKVKNFKTSEQTDVQKEEQLNTQDQLMTEENEVLQFKEDRVNPIDGQEENQASDKDSTPQAVFII